MLELNLIDPRLLNYKITLNLKKRTQMLLQKMLHGDTRFLSLTYNQAGNYNSMLLRVEINKFIEVLATV